MSDSYAKFRTYDLEELLGPDQARRLLALQAAGKRARTPAEHLEYRALIAKRDSKRHLAATARRLQQMLEQRTASSTSEAPVMAERTTEIPSPQPASPVADPPDERPFLPPAAPEASPVEHRAEVVAGELEESPFSPPPDPPAVIEGRKAEVRAYIGEFFDEWTAWIKSQGVWTPPALVQKWLARFGAGAAEGYGLLDHEPRREVMLAAFLGGTFVAFVPASLFALRNWRSGGREHSEAAARARREAEREEEAEAYSH